MPVFYFLVVVGIILLWFSLAFAFGWIGKTTKKFFGDAFKMMKDEEREEENE